MSSLENFLKKHLTYKNNLRDLHTNKLKYPTHTQKDLEDMEKVEKLLHHGYYEQLGKGYAKKLSKKRSKKRSIKHSLKKRSKKRSIKHSSKKRSKKRSTKKRSNKRRSVNFK